MSLFMIALRNIRQRLLSSTLTMLSVMLGVGLVTVLWMAATQSEEAYARAYKGYPILIGPRGMSPLDIVLDTIYHKGGSNGIVPLATYKELHDGRLAKKYGTRFAIPFTVGDSYRGYRIVGTTDELFKRFGYERDEKRRPIPLGFAEGNPFVFPHEELIAEAGRLARWHAEGKEKEPAPESWRQVVIGAKVAQQLGLKLGDQVIPAHGLEHTLEEHEEDACEVVGILDWTRTPTDSVLFMPIGLFYRMEGHEPHGGEEKKFGEDEVEISSIALNLKNPLGPLVMTNIFRRRPDAQAVFPQQVVVKLFRDFGSVSLVLRGIAWLVILVGAIGVFNSIYQTMYERRRGVAIMRALGASRGQIFGIVLTEALFITTLGALLGLLCGHVAAGVAAGWFEEQARVVLDPFRFEIMEVWLLLGVVTLGGIAGLLPAWAIARTNVAGNLAPQ
jgi:putative ABC transport system permease protein